MDLQTCSQKLVWVYGCRKVESTKGNQLTTACEGLSAGQLRAAGCCLVDEPLDRPARIALRKRLPLFLCGVRTGPAQQCVRELFSELDNRLVERVAPVQLPRVRGC